MAGRNAEDYPKFEDHPKCGKCGCETCSLRWNPDAQLLVATCARCGYAIFMQPLEEPEDESGE